MRSTNQNNKPATTYSRNKKTNTKTTYAAKAANSTY